MARIEGRSPRPEGTERLADDSEQTPSRLSKRVAQPVSGRRGRFGYYSGFRPSWHRWVGIAIMVAGVAIAVLNDVMFFTDTPILPFGHQELWLATGVVVAGFGSWFLGLFDPSFTRSRRPSG